MELIHAEIEKTNITKPQIKNRNDPTRTNIQKLNMFQADRLDGNAFQEFVAELLKSDGFSDVVVTGKSGDQGGDVLATKDGTKYVFQAKRYSIDRKVSNGAVQEAHGAVAYYDADVGIVITNSFYTNGARELATKIGIVLWNRKDVIKLIENFNGDNNI
ncbi:restriction endonuclease [Nitrosopumilus sp.]|uniref:restriction endonuclease n=1 Tax=Nitrosopumilus sp. TaxID=2024843 RepID=UPI0026137287|nr:restriction endonuclease [Nitrosopumilus sp.]